MPVLYNNFKPQNKVFLGDSGSLFLGGVVSIYVLHILSNEYIINPEFDINKIFFVISILSYPIIDMVRVFFLRITGSVFEADKNHLHHKFLERLEKLSSCFSYCYNLSFNFFLFQIIF